MQTVEETLSSLQHFGWSDYVVFALMLILSGGVGVYFAIWEAKTSTALEYLGGGRNLQILPVSMSIVASIVTGLTLLGYSTEVYIYGLHYAGVLIAIVFVGISMHYLFLPVFYELNCISIYEYFELRFDKNLRIFGSIMYLFSQVIRLPLAIYISVVAFEQIAGVTIAITTPIICLVCISYTCWGGIKVVIWTDVLQALIMLVSLAIVSIKATIFVGGLGVVLEQNLISTRIEAPIFSPDPTIRTSTWSSVIGGFFFMLSICCFEQSLNQRYISLPSMRQARQALWIFVVAFCFICSFALYNGFLLATVFDGCDPLSTGLVKRKDQLVPLLVMQSVRGYPAISGLFVAGILSAALSTASTALNSMSAVVLEDLVKRALNKNPSQRTTVFILRVTVIIAGIITTSLVFFVEELGHALELCFAFLGLTNGALSGLFFIGLTMPWIGSKSALPAAVCGAVLSGWIIFKFQIDTAAKILTFKTKPMTTENCLYTFNVTVQVAPEDSDRSFYHISYLYHVFIGVFFTIVLANLFCLFVGKQNSKKVKLELLTPPLRKFYKESTNNSEVLKIEEMKLMTGAL